MKTVVIFAPFWRQVGHIGNNRVERFVRWLAEDAYYVVVVCAGSSDDEQQKSWGQEITVRDRMGLFRNPSSDGGKPLKQRKPNKLRRTVAYWLFNPDPSVVWARAAARHSKVIQAVTGAQFILSSSPPESAHVGAWMLAQQLKVPHIVDMRDGWLDEPIKPILLSSAFRRWQEGRLEKRILKSAVTVLVTSDEWKDLLCQRLPNLSSKVHILTNGYPQYNFVMPILEEQANKPLLLIHAGRFLGSQLTRSPDLLLAPLLLSLSSHSVKGVIQLIGSLSVDEIKIIERFKEKFAAIGWEIEYTGNLPRQELLALLQKADGLLLLSASYAAIPSKLFEYIPTGKPIFAVTERGSATWRVCEELPQVTLVDAQNNNKGTQYFDFTPLLKVAPSIPEKYSENELKKVLLHAMDKIVPVK